jgi:hypothetical protein
LIYEHYNIIHLGNVLREEVWDDPLDGCEDGFNDCPVSGEGRVLLGEGDNNLETGEIEVKDWCGTAGVCNLLKYAGEFFSLIH